jgi:hypothetical protein
MITLYVFDFHGTLAKEAGGKGGLNEIHAKIKNHIKEKELIYSDVTGEQIRDFLDELHIPKTELCPQYTELLNFTMSHSNDFFGIASAAEVEKFMHGILLYVYGNVPCPFTPAGIVSAKTIGLPIYQNQYRYPSKKRHIEIIKSQLDIQPDVTYLIDNSPDELKRLEADDKTIIPIKIEGSTTYFRASDIPNADEVAIGGCIHVAKYYCSNCMVATVCSEYCLQQHAPFCK